MDNKYQFSKYKFTKDIILKFFPNILNVYDQHEYIWIAGSEIFGYKCNYVMLKYEYEKIAVPYKLGLNEKGFVIAIDKHDNQADNFRQYKIFKEPTKHDIETACTHLLEQIKLAKEQIKLRDLNNDF